MHHCRMTLRNGHSAPETDTYYLHMHPVSHTAAELPLGSPWSSENPNVVTYVSVGRAKFSAKVQEVRERLTAHGIVITGPLVPADADAAQKSRHDTWELQIPHGKEIDATYATGNIGSIVGPIRTEAMYAVNENHGTNGISTPLTKPHTRNRITVPDNA